MDADERGALVRGVGWTALQTWVLRAASFATFIVLGRLLAPAQIGLASLALAVTGFVVVVVDVGISSSVVRLEELTDRMVSTAFWLSLAQAVIGAAVLLGGAAPLSSALGHPELAPYLRVLALSVVGYGLSAVPAALLVRELRFRTLAVREVVAGLVSAVTGIGLAVAGAGVWALVAQNLTQGLVALVLLWTLQRWRPRFTFGGAEAKALVRFGAPLLGTSIVQALRDRTEQILLGAIAGVTVLGYWTIATRILAVLTEVTLATLNLVALPLFSRARQSDGGLVRAFSRASAYSVAVMAPALALLAVLTPRLLPVVFGDRWAPAVLPAQVLCAAYAVGSLVYFTRAALLASGRSGSDFALALATFALHLGVVVAVAPHGLTALSIAIVVEAVVVGLLSAAVLRARLGLGPRAFSDAVRALAVSAVSGAVMALTWAPLHEGPLLVAAAATGVVGVASQLVLLRLLLRDLFEALVAELGRAVPRPGRMS